MFRKYESLYRNGLPIVAHKIINHANTASKEIVATSLLDSQLGKTSQKIDFALQSRDHEGERDTIILQKRAMHIPVEALAIKLRRAFWHREKGARMLATMKSSRSRL